MNQTWCIAVGAAQVFGPGFTLPPWSVIPQEFYAFGEVLPSEELDLVPGTLFEIPLAHTPTVDQNQVAARVKTLGGLRCGFTQQLFEEGEWSGSASLLTQFEQCRLMFGFSATQNQLRFLEDRLAIEVAPRPLSFVLACAANDNVRVELWVYRENSADSGWHLEQDLNLRVFGENQFEHILSR